MLLKRVLTAAVTIPIVTAIIYWGGQIVFLFLVLLVAGIGLYEFFEAALPDEKLWARIPGIVCGLLIICAVFIDTKVAVADPDTTHLFFIGTLACCLIVLFIFYVLTTRPMVKAYSQILIKSFGIFYISLFLSFFVLVRSLADGSSLIFFLLLVTWAGDTGAYAVGSWKGQVLLCPEISPKKTVEGALGGFFFGVITALLCKFFLLKNLGPLSIILLGAGINILNQLGDLSESLIKRGLGIKESGTLLPGHGGVLDRIDSLLFAAPLLFYYARIAI
jgi:phosphatidate cytidylyltransferase